MISHHYVTCSGHHDCRARRELRSAGTLPSGWTTKRGLPQCPGCKRKTRTQSGARPVAEDAILVWLHGQHGWRTRDQIGVAVGIGDGYAGELCRALVTEELVDQRHVTRRGRTGGRLMLYRAREASK